MDTDAIVLTTKAVECIGITELWAGFGVSYRFCLIATHETSDALSPQQSMAFLICSLLSLGVIVYIILGGVGKGVGVGGRGGEKQLGKCGWHLMMSLKPSVT